MISTKCKIRNFSFVSSIIDLLMKRLPSEIILDIENRTFQIIVAEFIMKSKLDIQTQLVLKYEPWINA